MCEVPLHHIRVRGTPVVKHGLIGGRERTRPYRGTSLIRNRPPPREYHRALGIALLKGPKGKRFLVSEVSLYGDLL